MNILASDKRTNKEVLWRPGESDEPDLLTGYRSEL
jgi:hypothetical protein